MGEAGLCDLAIVARGHTNPGDNKAGWAMVDFMRQVREWADQRGPRDGSGRLRRSPAMLSILNSLTAGLASLQLPGIDAVLLQTAQADLLKLADLVEEQ